MHQVTPVNTSSTSEWAFEKEGCAEWAWGGNLRTTRRAPLQWQQLDLEVMYCVEKLLGSSNVWGMRRRQGRGRMGSESSRKWGEQKGPRGAASSSSFQRAFEATKSRRDPNIQQGSSSSCLNIRWVKKCRKVIAQP